MLLFNSLSLQNITLKNRIIVSPMCQYSSIDGFATNWHLVHLGQFAIGQAAAVIQEATAVSPEGRISYADLGIWKDEHIEKLSEITAFLEEQGAVPGIQLAHAGRKASTEKPWISRKQIAPDNINGWQTYGPSETAFHRSENPPLALSIEQIQQVISDFKDAARRSVMAGYKIIEIHGAHGYLIHQFLSPLVNSRTDQYGGTFENRIRLLLEVIDAVKTELTTQSLWVRLSGTDWAEGGWDIESTVQLVTLLKERGVEVADISSGGAVVHQQISVGPGYQVPLAGAVKKDTNMVTSAVGMINSGIQANQILENGEADLIMAARAMLADPHFPLRAAHDLKVDIAWPVQYDRAAGTF
jgi:2,4-dienoyl-CoA reductase-like NADH-dependent reductase (Old Yellow Enzyme family)